MPLRVFLATMLICSLSLGGEPNLTREDVVAAMKPYEGSPSDGTDRSTLTGKVMCGYQGWFAAEGDGSQRGWRHYSYRGRFEPGACGIDLPT